MENPAVSLAYEQCIVTDTGILSYKKEEIINDKYRQRSAYIEILDIQINNLCVGKIHW